jgi:hypothetical protein
VEDARLAELRILTGSVSVEEDHGPARIDMWHEPGFQWHTARASEHMSLELETQITRRATVLRPGHFDALHEDLHLLAQREHLRSRCPMPGRRKVSERASLPVSHEVEHGEPHEEHADPLHSREKAHH